METDRHYFIVGLFIIGLTLAAALFAIWLTVKGNRSDVIYRIRFSDSVSGLALGDPVKYQGVNVGTVRALALDSADPRRVQVDVALRKETPVKTDTKATLELKGITGVVFIELNGGTPNAQSLLAVTPKDQIPEIPSERSGLNIVLDQLPKVIEKFSSLEDQSKKVVTEIGEVTSKVKENPSLLLNPPKGEATPAPRTTPTR